MIHTLEQNVLIAMLFKSQFGDKTLKELFPEIPDGYYRGLIGDLHIQTEYLCYDFVFLMNEVDVAVAFLPFHNEDKFVVWNPYGANYHIPIERVIGLLNFEDKI